MQSSLLAFRSPWGIGRGILGGRAAQLKSLFDALRISASCSTNPENSTGMLPYQTVVEAVLKIYGAVFLCLSEMALPAAAVRSERGVFDPSFAGKAGEACALDGF